MRALVGNKREYHYLKGCAEYFVFPKVLAKRIIDGRANRDWVRGALSLRSKFITRTSDDEDDNVEAEAIKAFNRVCEELDSEDLVLVKLKDALDALLPAPDAESGTTYSNKFDKKYDLDSGDVDEKLNGDPKHNALLLVGELVRTGNIEGSSKKTRRLKGMDVRHNEISGFVDLVNILPKDAKKLALKELFG